jgi:hypothetical protein
MLADSQPMAHPPKNTVKVWRVPSPAWVHTAARMTAHTTPHAML